jgi:hypothetical protein
MHFALRRWRGVLRATDQVSVTCHWIGLSINRLLPSPNVYCNLNTKSVTKNNAYTSAGGAMRCGGRDEMLRVPDDT